MTVSSFSRTNISNLVAKILEGLGHKAKSSSTNYSKKVVNPLFSKKDETVKEHKKIFESFGSSIDEIISPGEGPVRDSSSSLREFESDSMGYNPDTSIDGEMYDNTVLKSGQFCR